MHSIQLPGGTMMPQLALGTWLISDNDAVEAVRSALMLTR